MTCVFKLSEPWEAEDASYAPRRSYKSAVNRVMKAPSLKAKISDADYYTNYTIMPISASSITGINDIDATKQAVKVSYVNMTGNVSDNPFPGMNIVITHYNDGTKAITKAVK